MAIFVRQERLTFNRNFVAAIAAERQTKEDKRDEWMNHQGIWV
jgi:hypothetical protein